MLLQELAGVKRFQKYTTDQLFKMFRRMGVKIAHGKYGMVFIHPSWNYVVKLVENDPSYMGFVNYVLQHPNKHFPKFVRQPTLLHKFHQRPSNEGTSWWVVRMEKLNEITDRKLLKFIVHNLEAGMTAVYGEQRGDNYSLDFKGKTLGVWLPDGELHTNVSMRDVFEKYPWFKTLSEAAAHYNAFYQDEGPGVNDIHGGNFMRREDGTIVFIDPSWAGTNPYQLEREYMRGYEDYYDQPDYDMVKGPILPNKQKKLEQERKEQREKEKKERASQPWNGNDDDIPF